MYVLFFKKIWSQLNHKHCISYKTEFKFLLKKKRIPHSIDFTQLLQ